MKCSTLTLYLDTANAWKPLCKGTKNSTKRIPSPAIPRTEARVGSRRMSGSPDIRFPAHYCPPALIFLRHRRDIFAKADRILIPPGRIPFFLYCSHCCNAMQVFTAEQKDRKTLYHSTWNVGHSKKKRIYTLLKTNISKSVSRIGLNNHYLLYFYLLFHHSCCIPAALCCIFVFASLWKDTCGPVPNSNIIWFSEPVSVLNARNSFREYHCTANNFIFNLPTSLFKTMINGTK